MFERCHQIRNTFPGMNTLKKFVAVNFPENFAKWAIIQITDAMDRWGQRRSVDFLVWLKNNGHVSIPGEWDNKKMRRLYKMFEKSDV
jgi:hypothetical protein